MVEFNILFAAEMRRLRKGLDLAQEAVGVTLGLDRNSISRFERDSPNITVEKARVIADVLGVSLWSMLGDPTPADEDHVPTSFRERVRSLRIKQGLKQRELAERMGVDRNLVSAIESGKHIASLKTVQLYCVGFGVKPSDLLSEPKPIIEPSQSPRG